MQKTYSPQVIENDCLKRWVQPNYFRPEKGDENYCIMQPPPNITGGLHMGHGLQTSQMDAMVRYKRMQGYRVLWQGGTDHAGIATQMIVEKQLLAEGKERALIKREELFDALSSWKDQSEKRINSQLRRLGASIDFERNRFTLDETFDKAVRHVFVALHQEGLLYRGKRLVNWDPRLLTAISDLEVMHVEEKGWLYYIRYPILDNNNYITVATTRPETLFGDVALAVHPEDTRYQSFIGCSLKVPLTDRIISLIADRDVDPAFGTGCVKITPAHDFNDYKVGQRHQLPLLNILTPEAKLNDQVPEQYQGMTCALARELVISRLSEQSLLAKKESHTLHVPRGDRSDAIIEPYLTDQWFIHMEPLAKKAIHSIKSGDIKFVPENWATTCLQWLENIEDWCISRQLWWGHRIPAWYTEEGNYFIGMNEKAVRDQYNIPETTLLKQENDVLDTWVSSALWPFVTLGWPQKNEYLKAFYPTDVLVTGFDIIFFWVARMLMLGLHFTQQVPFKTVYVTGLIRDHLGQKMSKSKGNVLDPLDIIEGITLNELAIKRTKGLMQPKMAHSIDQVTRQQFPKGIDAFGADALRMTYYSLASPTRDIRFDMNRTLGYRNFCNKLWQVTRFALQQHHEKTWATLPLPPQLSFNCWILSRLQHVIQRSHQYFSSYRFDLLIKLLYEFVWHDYCDWYVELVKPYLKSEDTVLREETYHTLVIVLDNILRLLHPLAPFITETLWLELHQVIFKENIQKFQPKYPVLNTQYINNALEERITWLQEIIKMIRSVRSQRNLTRHQPIVVICETQDSALQQKILEYQSTIEILTYCKLEVVFDKKEQLPDVVNSMTLTMDSLTLYVVLDNQISPLEESQRLKKEKGELEENISRLKKRLNNKQFLVKASSSVVEQTRSRLITDQEKLSMIITQLNVLPTDN